MANVIRQVGNQLGKPDMPLRNRADVLFKYTSAQQRDCTCAALGLK